MLLRKRRADFDMQNEHDRAVVTKEDITSELLFFLDGKFNEVKIQKEIESTIKKVQDLGFLKRLKSDDEAYEIKSAIKSFIDAKWLNDFDLKLQEYKEANVWN
jgi:hypothetical protein